MLIDTPLVERARARIRALVHSLNSQTTCHARVQDSTSPINTLLCAYREGACKKPVESQLTIRPGLEFLSTRMRYTVLTPLGGIP